MTINEMIAALEKMKDEANLKGETVVHFCIQNIPYIPVNRVKVENDSSGGSTCILIPEYEQPCRCLG